MLRGEAIRCGAPADVWQPLPFSYARRKGKHLTSIGERYPRLPSSAAAAHLPLNIVALQKLMRRYLGAAMRIAGATSGLGPARAARVVKAEQHLLLG